MSAIILELSTLSYPDQTRRVLRWCNDHFEVGSFDEVIKVLDSINPEEMHFQTLVSFLAFTYPASKQLGKSRIHYAERIYQNLSDVMTSEVVDRIYGRLCPEAIK